MKKVRNLLIIFALALCIVVVPNKVNAAASNYMLYCDKETITRGDSATCYLLAQIDDQGIFGVYADLNYERLTIEGHGIIYNDIMTVTEINKGAERPNVGTGVTCTSNGKCYDFQANTGSLITNKAGATGVDIINTNHSGYTPIGYWTVKVREDATDENCGKICVSVQAKNTSTSQLGSNPQECVEIHPKDEEVKVKTCTYDETNKIYYDKNGNVVDEAEYKKQCKVNPPQTGSFASYAVLAAGAFIALSAITIAKKHNKFYKV